MNSVLSSLARPFLERMVFTRRLPADLGNTPIYVSPRIDARVLRSSLDKMDPDLLAAARHLVKSGACVWDIGSNLGVFTMSSAFLAGPEGFVLAVDADAAHVDLLRRTSRRAEGRSVSPVVPLYAAVAAAVGISEFNIVSRGKAKNFLADVAASTQVGDIVESQRVVTVTLDWLAEHFRAPDVLKIDIEGAELKALEGAASLLNTTRPSIYIEVQETNISAVTTLLQSCGYRLFELNACSSELATLERCAFNTVALPMKTVK